MVNSKHLPLAILTFSSSDCAMPISTVLFDVPFHVFYLFLFLYRVQCRLSIGKCLRDKSSQGDCTNSLSMWHMRHSTQCIAMRLWTMFVLQTLWPRSNRSVYIWGSADASSAELFHVDQVLQHHMYWVAHPVCRCDEHHLKLNFYRYLKTKFFHWKKMTWYVREA